MERQFIDVCEDRGMCGDLRLKVHVDPARHYIQERSVLFPWTYRIRSSVVYLEELEPERRILDAYLKGERISKGTVLFRPYKKPYTSCILRKFVYEDPYDPKRAILKYCREQPIKFVIFSKPGLNVDSLAIEVSKSWGSVHISPQISINTIKTSNIAENTKKRLQKGDSVGVIDILTHIKEKLASAESKKNGYVLTGLPMRHHMDSDFHILEQMEMIFETETRPDIIIYLSSPSSDIRSLNDIGFISDLKSGFNYNKNYLKDAAELQGYGFNPDDLEKSTKHDYNYFLLKELFDYNAMLGHGLPVDIGKLPSYSADLVEDYVKKILPIIDSYVLEYDTQCVVKLDGRIPVANMFEIVKAKLSTLPYIPTCKARPIFEEMIEPVVDTDPSDDRSEDSIKEYSPESELVEEDDEDAETFEEEEEEEEEEEVAIQEEEAMQDEAAEEYETQPAKKVDKELQHLSNMVPEEALRRLKDYNKVDPNFKWSESDYGAHCPVELERGNICLGAPKYTCTYLGNLYMMSTLEAMHEFLSDPNRYAIPPKPFPTFKIFVVGPPQSGKTTVIKALSGFFDLRVIYMKKLIEEIRREKFFNMEIRELIRKQLKLRKVQDLEDAIFNSYEKRRCSDIVDWIREQLPYIYQRIKYTSLIEIPSVDDLSGEGNSKEEAEEEASGEEEEVNAEFILPMQEGFLETLNRMTKPDLKTIIALKKYTLDLPLKSGYEKIYENIDTDQHSMLVNAIPYEAANVNMSKLKEEFKERGLDFYLNTEEYIGIFLNPSRLLPYLPIRYRQPYYMESRVEYEDPRVRDPHTDHIGIRSEFGFISVNAEELVDKFENTILEIEAENNLQQKGDDLQIGGWIVDDVPLDKKFWKLLVERYLLPDDLVIRTVPTNSHDKMIKNFCNVISVDDSNDVDKQKTAQDGLKHDSEQSLKDIETDRFLAVRNSFLQVNKLYETTFRDTDDEELTVPKTYWTDEEKPIVTQEVLDALPKPNETKYEEVRFIYSTEKTARIDAVNITWREPLENPFNLKMLHMKPFHLNFWTDDKFLVEVYEDITKKSLSSTGAAVEVETIYVAENLTETSMSELSTNVRKMIIPDSKQYLLSESSYSSESQDSSTSKQSISSSDASTGMVIADAKPYKKGYLADKTRLSLLKKQKTKRKNISVYTAVAASRCDPTSPERLFELHGKMILNKPKIDSKEYDLFQIFYREIVSHISADPKTFELKYLTEIKVMLENGANLNEVANAMVQYLRRVKKAEESQDNILLKRPSVDTDIDKHRPLRPISKTIDVISQTDIRGRLRRTDSKIQFERSDSQTSSIKELHKVSAISRMSPVPLDDETLEHYLREGVEPLGSNILCYKDSVEDIYKSSSVLLNVEMLVSDQSMNITLDRNDGIGKLQLPKIDDSDRKTGQHSCYCLHPQTKEICNCSSSSSASEIEAERKKKRLCIYDDSSMTMFPWIPVEEQIRNLRPEEKVELPRRGRQMTSMRTMETVDKIYLDTIHDSTESCEETLEDFPETEEQEEEENVQTGITFFNEQTEEQEEQEEEEKEEVSVQTGMTLFSEHTENRESYMQDVTEQQDVTKQQSFLSGEITDTAQRVTKKRSDERLSVKLKSSTTDILEYVPHNSAVSLFYKTFTENLLKSPKYSKDNDLSSDDEDSSLYGGSEYRYRSKDTLAMTLTNIEGYGSDTLLPGFEGNEWERFINFVNGLYLSVSSYKDLGFKTETNDNFYLQCCPSTSETSLKDYQDRPSTVMKKSRNRWDRFIRSSSELLRQDGRAVTEYQEEEDICVLEVALPMAEPRLNTALTTVLKCLTLGKTISELFSANKHDRLGRQRMTVSALNVMYEDDTVRDLKTASESFGLDQQSDVMPIDDVSSSDAIFNEDGQLVEDHKTIELYDGGLVQYRSFDQCFRPSLEMLPDGESDTDQEDEIDDCPETFLSTVPRAILYVPYIVPRFRPVTKNKRVTSKHLRRYYSLQSMCRLVYVDSDHECLKDSDNTKGEQEEEEVEEEEEAALKFRYILKKRYTKSFKSIYIHRPTALNKKVSNQEGEDEEEENQADLKLIQDIIEPLIDVFREEIIKAEMSEKTSKLTPQGKTKMDFVTMDEYTKLNLKTPIPRSALKKVSDFKTEERILSFTGDHSQYEDLRPYGEETTSEEDEIEEKIEKHLTFSYPYDIIKLIFQKYNFITMQMPQDDMDETLITELNHIKTPKRFQCFLDAFDYNVRIWLGQWDKFQREVLSNVRCNLIDVAFVPYKINFHNNLNDSIAKLLRNYEPQAERVDIIKEKLIKTIDLETADLEVDDIEELTDIDATEITEVKDRDIGDTEIRELLPNEYSDFYPYCPILYKQTNELVPVNNLYSAAYREKYFNFSTEDDVNEFIRWPEYYSVVKEYEYSTTPIRIFVVAPRDLDEMVHIGRRLADLMALPFKTLTAEIKRVRGRTLNLPVGIFDEDQTNIKLFGLDENNEDPQQDILENTEWDHIRSYFNLKTALREDELQALIEPLWKANYGHVFHGFPHTFEDFEYTVRMKMIPEAVVFIDVEDQRAVRSKEIEDRIKARQVLNFGARLKRLLSADHLRYIVWKEAYPKLFNIVLRKFLRERRAERNFRERLNLILPTLMTSEMSLMSEEEDVDDVRPWDVEWLLYQVAGTQSKAINTIPSSSDLRKNKKFINVLDDPTINEEEKKKFLEQLQKKTVAAELLGVTDSPPELLIEEEEGDDGESQEISIQRELLNLSDTDFPDVRSIFEPTVANISEEDSQNDVYEDLSKSKDDLITSSDEKMNAGIKIVNRRQVAVTDMFNPPFEKKYLPKFRQVVYKSQRPFDPEQYRKNVTDASSTSLLGLDITDSIESRELTSSLSLLDVESRNKKFRLMQLILGNKIALKDHFMNIVDQFKKSHPAPPSNARKLTPIGFKHLKRELKDYYKTEKEHVKRMKELCETQNIPYVVHKSNSHIKDLVQNVKNIIRKPHAFERVYIVNYKTANKLLENGFYFLSRFGYWCPVQLYERECPLQDHYSDNARENIIVPVIHKRYIYFLNGRRAAIKFAQSPLTYIKQQDTMTVFPVKVAIAGLHKSQKTFLAKNLAIQLGLQYISVDQTIRYVLEKLYWSALAKNIVTELQKGEVVSHKHIIKCIEAFINSSAKSLKYGWVLDGFPNTVDDLSVMRENDIIPNVVFGMEPAEDHVKDIFCNLDEDRTVILNNSYDENEFLDMEGDEQEDAYYKSLHNSAEEVKAYPFENGAINENKIKDFYDVEEEEEGDETVVVPEEMPENIYVKRIKELLDAKHSITIEPVHIEDFDQKVIDFELNILLPPAQMIETRILSWLKDVKTYDRMMKTTTTWWGNFYQLEWTKDTTKLLERTHEILKAFVWALQDYNLKVSKGLPASLYLTGITEEEYQLHKSPFNDCCPGCWYYYRVYFRCPTCLFKDMMPGMVQYENYFYWLCIQHYDMFLSNPVRFLMSYESRYSKNYPEKTVIGESFLENNLNVQYNGLCITCYYNHLPELKHVKGYGKYSVIINKTDIYLFCSNRCVCEMLMRPARYINLEIEYTDGNNLPPLRNLKQSKVMYKRIFEQMVSDTIYDCVRKFLFMRPKLYRLSHKSSACTYLALHLKLKAKSISQCEFKYYNKKLKYMEKHCQEVETFCRHIDEVFAFYGPLSIIEQTKAKCLPREVQDMLLKNLLPQRRRKQIKPKKNAPVTLK